MSKQRHVTQICRISFSQGSWRLGPIRPGDINFSLVDNINIIFLTMLHCCKILLTILVISIYQLQATPLLWLHSHSLSPAGNADSLIQIGAAIFNLL